MPSLSSQWEAVKNAWNDSKSSESPGGRFGLMFDPTAYVLDAFGKGDEYRNAITKSGDWMNERLSGALGTSDRNGWAANKPASTIGLMAASYFGGSGLMGGMGGGGAGGSSSGGLGIFSNGGKAGMSGVGQGNVGQLFANTGFNTGGVAGVGGTGASGSGFLGSLQQNPQQYLQMLQGQQQTQQQEQRPLQPVVIKGRIFWV